MQWQWSALEACVTKACILQLPNHASLTVACSAGALCKLSGMEPLTIVSSQQDQSALLAARLTLGISRMAWLLKVKRLVSPSLPHCCASTDCALPPPCFALCPQGVVHRDIKVGEDERLCNHRKRAACNLVRSASQEDASEVVSQVNRHCEMCSEVVTPVSGKRPLPNIVKM